MNRDKLIGKEPEQSQISAGTQPGIGAGTTRRRLLKQAATVAPVIMTLRSGSALALGSACINKAAGVTATGGGTNRIEQIAPTYIDDYVCLASNNTTHLEFTSVTDTSGKVTYTCQGTIVTASSEASADLGDTFC